MKKIISVILIFSVIFLCSCKEDEVHIDKSSDMLNITNEDKTFSACMSRYNAVISAIKTKITVLEEEHNSLIEYNRPEDYFLDENYIHTIFNPFSLESLSVTDGFTDEMTQEKAQSYYSELSGDMNITFTKENESYELLFTSESIIKKHCALYDKKADSLRYTYVIEEAGTEKTIEFLEFNHIDDNVYIIQSNSERCYVQFSENGDIIYCITAKLNNGRFSLKQSVYPDIKEDINGFWTIDKGKSEYISVHTFENNVLTCEDSSSGVWKSVKINASDYDSAFIGI